MIVPKEIVKKYLSMLSGTGNIVDKYSSLNFRCPYCGDSKYSKKKQRGNIKFTDAVVYFKCFNCGLTVNIYNFFSGIDKKLGKEFKNEIREFNGKNLFTKKKTGDAEKIKTAIKKNKKRKRFTMNKFLSYLKERKAVDFKVSKEYLEKRQINLTNYIKNNIYYISNIKKFMDKFFKNRDINIHGNGLLIPTYDLIGNMIGFQIRIFGKSSLRYFGMKIEEDDSRNMYFNIPNVKFEGDIFINEGFFDGCFLKNNISVAGISNILQLIDFITEKNIETKNIYVVTDNEKYNKELIKIMKKILKRGCNLFIWDEKVKSNDLNDLAIELNKKDLSDYVKKRSVRGLKGELRLTSWITR